MHGQSNPPRGARQGGGVGALSTPQGSQRGGGVCVLDREAGRVYSEFKASRSGITRNATREEKEDE